MNSGTKILIALLAAVAAGALYLALGNDSPTPVPDPTPVGQQPEQNDDPVQQRGGNNATRTGTATPSESDPQPVRQGDVEGRDPGQGLTGIVVDTANRPLPDVYVAVFDASQGGLVQMVQATQDGVVRRPLAETRTDEFGEFKLPIVEMQPVSQFELYAIDEVHSDLNRRGVRGTPGEYVDLGRLEMANGNRIGGVVRVKETGAAIAGATVQMIPPNYSFKPARVPGRELTTAFGLPNQQNSMTGIEVQTDPSGRFEFTNAPAGSVRLVAFADGFARQERQNVIVDPATPLQLEFALSPGLAIAGHVIDSDEQPVAGARITVAALSQVSPGQAEGLSDEQGRFRIDGLEEGPYRVLVAAKGYIRPEALPPVEAGTLDEILVLEPQGEALLTVKTPQGRALRRYQALTRSYHAQSEMVGQAFGRSPARVTDRDLEDGKFRIRGLDPGTYKVEVRANGFAMSYSEPFQITRGGPPVEVTCVLSEGGELEGTVTTPNGGVLAGATVDTLPNQYVELGANNFFSALQVWNVTRQSVRTDQNGRFLLKKLTPGLYQLRFKHPDWSTVYVKDIEVRDGDRTDAGRIDLVAGTRVSGVAYVNGTPTGQIQVSISAANEPGTPAVPFNATALTKSDGTFEMPQLIPPGKYRIAARRSAVDPNNIFANIVDMQQTQQEVEFVPGQQSFELTFNIQVN